MGCFALTPIKVEPRAGSQSVARRLISRKQQLRLSRRIMSAAISAGSGSIRTDGARPDSRSSFRQTSIRGTPRSLRKAYPLGL